MKNSNFFWMGQNAPAAVVGPSVMTQPVFVGPRLVPAPGVFVTEVAPAPIPSWVLPVAALAGVGLLIAALK